jgi:hypothetical protein
MRFVEFPILRSLLVGRLEEMDLTCVIELAQL